MRLTPHGPPVCAQDMTGTNIAAMRFFKAQLGDNKGAVFADSVSRAKKRSRE